MIEQNPIYDFMKSNKLTDLDEKAFLSKYSAPDKAKEVYSFFVENDLTDLDSAKFYDKYLKKKELSLPSGEVSSPTELPSASQDISLTPKAPRKQYYNEKLEKGLIFDKAGQLYAPSSEALSKSIKITEPVDLKKSTQKDLVEQSREMPIAEPETEPIEKQGWLLNTVSALDKGFAKNFASSPIKGLGTLLQGATKKVLGGTGEGYISDKLIKFGDYLNNAIDELTPQDEEFKNGLLDQAAQALGQVGALVLTGGLTGAAGKGAALVAQAPKGAAITAVKTLGSQLASPTAVSGGLSMGQAEFDRAKEAGATDDQAFEAFYKNAATGSVLETIPVMQFFKRFNKSTAGGIVNYIKTKGVAGVTGGVEEMTTEILEQVYANKTAKDIYNINQSILDGVGTSGGVGFGIGFVLNAMGANARILRKQGREQEATVLENQVKQYEDNLENPKVTSGNIAKDIVTQGVEVGTQKAVQDLDRDLANNVITPEKYQESYIFIEKAAQVADKIPETVTGESRVKSVELLVERNDVKQANQDLLQQKQVTDEAYHAGIDEEIKSNEEKIKAIDANVYDIAKKPSKDFGDKKYVVDGEEVSKEAFEALQGKPLGTKEVIKAEVKPTEVKAELKPVEAKEEEITVYHGGEIDDLAKTEGGLFVTEDKKQAGAYAKGNEGNVQEFKINKSDISNEDEVRKIIVELGLKSKEAGWDLSKELMLHEILDPRFGTSLSDKDLDKLYKELEKRGYKAVEMSATDVTGKEFDVNDILVLNPKETLRISKPEVKAADKGPTKELAEGEEVTFNTPQGEKLKGEKVTIPGFEKIDMVVVKEGLNNRVYDLASGTELVDGEFSKENLIQSVIDQFKEKNITQPKIYNLIYKGSNRSSFESEGKIRQINPSSMFESYSEKRKVYDKAEYEKLPLKYTPEEINKLNKLKDKAIKNGLNEIAADIDKRIEERGSGVKVDYSSSFDIRINKGIAEKVKKEAEKNKVPYPKEYITPIAKENLAKAMMAGKKDKLSQVNPGVRKVIVDAWAKYVDLYNKYGYKFSESMDEFVTSLLRYSGTLGAEKNREERLAIEQKRLESSIEDMGKVYEKEFGKKEEAKPVEEVTKVEVTKDDIKKAEAKFAAAEDRFKKARNKIESTQVKQAGMFGGEQKGMFAMGGTEAKSTLEPLKKATKEAKAELDDIKNRIKVQEVAQPELAPVEKSKEKLIRKKEDEISADYYKTFPIGKIKDGSIGISTGDTYSTFKIEFKRQGKQVASPETVNQIKKWAESKGLEYTGMSKEDIRETVNFKMPFEKAETPKKTYQEVLKEKQEAEKKLTRQVAGEKAAATRKIIDESSKIEATDARSAALKYLTGGNLSWDAIDEVAGRVKGARLNTGERELKSGEARLRDYVAKKGEGEDLNEAVHSIWSDISEELMGKVGTREIKNALMSVVSEFNSKAEAAKALIDGYKEESLEDQEAAFYKRYNFSEEEIDEELAKAEESIDDMEPDDYEFDLPEEHINNLINQYESEIKNEVKQPAERGKEKSAEKASSREAGKAEDGKSKELAKDFKEATAKAGKKAKENAKKDFVDRNFEDIVQKLKIQIKCPT